MILLDHLLNIEREEDSNARESYTEGLYLTNSIFAKYVDLCYSKKWKSKFPTIESIPEHKTDNVPYGYHYSQIEREFERFKAVGFVQNPQLNPSELSDDIRKNKLIQVLESVSDIEQRFLIYVLLGKLPFLSREKWKEIRYL